MLFIINLVLTAMVYPFIYLDITESHHPVILWLGSLEIILATIALVCGWLLFLMRYFDESNNPRAVVDSSRNPFIKLIQSLASNYNCLVQALTHLSLTAALSLDLIRHTYASDYHIHHDAASLNFHDLYAEVNVIPIDVAVWLIFSPLVFIMVTRECRFPILLSVFGIITFGLIYSAASIASSKSVSVILPFLVFYAILIINQLKQQLHQFLITCTLKETLLENERMAAEAHATEMRHMIANVAHDLKTVSTRDFEKFHPYSHLSVFADKAIIVLYGWNGSSNG
jgi:signal transduction histidine kinase